jgi:hypothetical protein
VMSAVPRLERRLEVVGMVWSPIVAECVRESDSLIGVDRSV